MVSTQKLLGYLKLASSEQKLLDYMYTLGVDLKKELFLEKDEYGSYDGSDAYIERPLGGYCLLFSDEAEFLGKRDQPIGVGKLYFSTVFFYSEGKDEYSQYKGELPFGLSFEDRRENVVHKLGEQSWQRLAQDDERVISDRWDNLLEVAYRLHVSYYKDTGKISIISATIPDRSLIDGTKFD